MYNHCFISTRQTQRFIFTAFTHNPSVLSYKVAYCCMVGLVSRNEWHHSGEWLVSWICFTPVQCCYSPPEGGLHTLWWSSSPHSCPSVCLRQCERQSRPGWLWCCSPPCPWSETPQRLAQITSWIFERSSKYFTYFLAFVMANGNNCGCDFHSFIHVDIKTKHIRRLSNVISAHIQGLKPYSSNCVHIEYNFIIHTEPNHRLHGLRI